MGPSARAEPGGPIDRRAALADDDRPDRDHRPLRRSRPRSGPRRRPDRSRRLARSRTSVRVTAEAIGARARLGDDRPRSQDAARRTRSLGAGARRHSRALSRESRGDLGRAACAWSVLVSFRPASIPNAPTSSFSTPKCWKQYLKRYGPRVTTATGELGVAASQAEIWTPESTGRRRRSGRRAHLQRQAEEKSKLILPGQ